MPKKLPRHPSIEFYHKQAKQLLKDYRNGDARVSQRLLASLPELGNLTEKGTLAARLSLKGMLQMLAREHGFSTWADMKSEIVRKRIIVLPALSTIAGRFYEQRKEVVMRHVASATLQWSETLQDTEVVYDRISFAAGGRIAAVVRHAERSRVRDIEVEPSDEMLSWNFPGTHEGDEFYVGKSLHLSHRLESHPSAKVRTLMTEHLRDLRAGKASNHRLRELLSAVTRAEVSPVR